MLGNYINLLKLLDNYFDAIMIVDANFIIRYYNTFYKGALDNVDITTAVGKSPFDIFKNITPETSTLYKAIKNNKMTLNNFQTLTYANGKTEEVVDNTIPIIVDNKIVGALNTVKYLNKPEESKNKNILNDENKLYSIDDIIGQSSNILKLKKKIEKISKTNSNVFIYGETGTGKELVAQAIHEGSQRANNLFFSQSCAAIPYNLLESIFFGTTKGAFTDAKDKPGLFEVANGGTIFLDEINSMPQIMQAKLLKVIEEQKVKRIGGLKYKHINVRIIAASNENPFELIKKKNFRTDLFYRLSTIYLNIPSLLERKEDLPILIEHFIKKFNVIFNKNIIKIEPKAYEILKNYNYPGNIRELKNIIECAFNFADTDLITTNDLPDYLLDITINSNHNNNLSISVENFEKKFIEDNSKNATSLVELAKKLGISRQSLYNKMKKYNIKFDF